MTSSRSAKAELPTIPLSYEQWIAFHASLPTEVDIVGRNPVSPYQVMELERNAARSELKATRAELKELHQNAQQTINGLVQQHRQQTIFLAAIIHSLGGELVVPHASLDAIRAAPHKFDEHVDDAAKTTRIAIIAVTPDELKAMQQPAPVEQPTPREQAESEPATRPVIELVSR